MSSDRPAPATPPTRRTVHLVPHTHWDREWYLPFQTFRMRLVDGIDELLPDMEADDRLRFTLDGQLATVDDYLEIRPEAGARIAALVAAGRIAVGPWMILMDEFLVSGETIVRNLELGFQRAAAFGPAMRIGYLPDMFGHVAQMPQILARAGIRDAVVWRGVPSSIDRHVFDWRAPDGSVVRCEYLGKGYWGARDLFDHPVGAEGKLAAYVSSVNELFGSDDILAMYGADHMFPAMGLADVVDRVNREQDHFTIRIGTLSEYLAATRETSRPDATWEGELRSSSRANILMGVTSNHVDVRRAAGRAELALQRLAEPLAALHADPAAWPARELELAWRRVIENSAHDSICACSLDEVVSQVLVRFAEAEQLASGIVTRALATHAGRIPGGTWLVANPTPSSRIDLVEVEVPGGGADGESSLVDARGTALSIQELARGPRVLDRREILATGVPVYLARRMHGRELYLRLVNGWSRSGPDGDRLTIDVDRVPDPIDLDIDQILGQIAAAAASAPAGARWLIEVVERPSRTVLVRIPATGLGLTSLGPGPSGVADSASSDAPVVVSDRALTNGLLEVSVRHDGMLDLATLAGDRFEGLGRLADGGDVGDTYNYAPPPNDRVVDQPTSVRVRILEAGPLRGALEIGRRYAWPAGLSDDLARRRGVRHSVDIAMRVELRIGEPFVRLALAFDNPVGDHRLRLHLPLPRQARRSYAEGQFAIVERSLVSEDGHGEVALPTFPANAFVAAGGLAALFRHVVEYEVVEDGRELALTVLRATGLISRDDHPWRAEPAGPVIAVPAAQLIGPVLFECAIFPMDADVPGPEVIAAADAYRNPLVVRAGTGPTGAALIARDGLTIDGPGVGLSALRRVDDELEMRLVAETRQTVTATLRGGLLEAREVDLLGRPIGDPLVCTDGSVEIRMRPWEIRTLRLRTA